MDFDWSLYTDSDLSEAEVAETFEDPFSLRLLPDHPRFSQHARYFCLGRTLSGRGIFVAYTSTGKVVKAVMARPMTPEESHFYDRRLSQSL